MSVTITITGLQEVSQRLAALPTDLAKKVYRKALQAAGDVVLTEVVNRTPVDDSSRGQSYTSLEPGELRAAMGTQVRIGQTGASVLIGPDAEVGNVARWVELGHARKGHNDQTIGHVPPHPFMRPAAEASANAAVEAFADTMSENLDELAK